MTAAGMMADPELRAIRDGIRQPPPGSTYRIGSVQSPCLSIWVDFETRLPRDSIIVVSRREGLLHASFRCNGIVHRCSSSAVPSLVKLAAFCDLMYKIHDYSLTSLACEESVWEIGFKSNAPHGVLLEVTVMFDSPTIFAELVGCKRHN